MRYLVTARVKAGLARALARAIGSRTLGRGSVAGGEYLRNMAEARQLPDGRVQWVETCFCETPLEEERPYWEAYFDLLSVKDAHARARCRHENGEEVLGLLQLRLHRTARGCVGAPRRPVHSGRVDAREVVAPRPGRAGGAGGGGAGASSDRRSLVLELVLPADPARRHGGLQPGAVRGVRPPAAGGGRHRAADPAEGGSRLVARPVAGVGAGRGGAGGAGCRTVPLVLDLVGAQLPPDPARRAAGPGHACTPGRRSSGTGHSRGGGGQPAPRPRAPHRLR